MDSSESLKRTITKKKLYVNLFCTDNFDVTFVGVLLFMP